MTITDSLSNKNTLSVLGYISHKTTSTLIYRLYKNPLRSVVRGYILHKVNLESLHALHDSKSQRALHAVFMRTSNSQNHFSCNDMIENIIIFAPNVQQP